jgi:hypothetical protein
MFAEKNAIYLIAGYAVFLGGILIYLLTLVIRRHNLERDEELLEQISTQLEEQETQPSAVSEQEQP